MQVMQVTTGPCTYDIQRSFNFLTCLHFTQPISIARPQNWVNLQLPLYVEVICTGLLVTNFIALVVQTRPVWIMDPFRQWSLQRVCCLKIVYVVIGHLILCCSLKALHARMRVPFLHCLRAIAICTQYVFFEPLIPHNPCPVIISWII